MITQIQKNRRILAAVGLMFLSSPALALVVHNNSGYVLAVEGACSGKTFKFNVAVGQPGDCPESVCRLGTECTYLVDADGDGNCSGPPIDGGSGLQVDYTDGKLVCKPVDE